MNSTHAELQLHAVDQQRAFHTRVVPKARLYIRSSRAPPAFGKLGEACTRPLSPACSNGWHHRDGIARLLNDLEDKSGILGRTEV